MNTILQINIKLPKYIVLSVLLMSTFLYGNAINGKVATLTKQQQENLVRSTIPSTKIEKIARAKIDGFYKAYLKSGQILYVNPVNLTRPISKEI